MPPCHEPLHQLIQALVTLTNQWKIKGGGVGKLQDPDAKENNTDLSVRVGELMFYFALFSKQTSLKNKGQE